MHVPTKGLTYTNLSFYILVMGIGPVTAIQQALQRADIGLDQVDRVEINEAFAAQFLACAKELNVDMSKTNLNGGAISLGHPTGASGKWKGCVQYSTYRQEHGSI